MDEITNREQLEGWFRGYPREVAVAIASRSALRTLPMIARAVRNNLKTFPSAIALPIFRAMAAPWLAGTW
ncbi:MAG: hypothetical protein O3B08_10860, partial [Proteobacteria bacterium]|nr:hypothetical protein [Pseudomonadota bacterium]